MANQLYEHILGEQTPNNFKYLDDDLSHYCFIEIGSIERIYDTNRCTVLTNKVRNRHVVRYKDVEILYAGATVVPSGTPCILVRPLTAVPNTRDGKVDLDARPYDRSGMKAIPLFQGITGMDAGWNGSGDYIIKNGTKWQVRFEPNALVVSANKVPIATFHTDDNSQDFDFANGRFHQYWDSGHTKTVHFDTDGKIIAYDEIAADDTRTYCRGAKEEDIKLDDIPNRDNWNTVITIDPDGNVTFVSGDSDKISLSIDSTNSKIEAKVGDCSFSMDDMSKAIKFTDGTNKYETSPSGTVINGHLTVMP